MGKGNLFEKDKVEKIKKISQAVARALSKSLPRGQEGE
jgi:hypothetical protein